MHYKIKTNSIQIPSTINPRASPERLLKTVATSIEKVCQKMICPPPCGSPFCPKTRDCLTRHQTDTETHKVDDSFS